MIVWADVFVVPIFHAESAGDGAQLLKAETFVAVSCVDVGGNDGVELHDRKVMGSALFQAVADEFFTDMKSSAVSADGIAGVADMSASSYIIRMENVQAIDLICVHICGNGCISLFGEKVSAGVHV